MYHCSRCCGDIYLKFILQPESLCTTYIILSYKILKWVLFEMIFSKLCYTSIILSVTPQTCSYIFNDHPRLMQPLACMCSVWTVYLGLTYMCIHIHSCTHTHYLSHSGLPPLSLSLTHTHTLTGATLDSSERDDIISGVIQEADIGKTEQLSYTEFEHVISRAPDFVNLFHITI